MEEISINFCSEIILAIDFLFYLTINFNQNCLQVAKSSASSIYLIIYRYILYVNNMIYSTFNIEKLVFFRMS